MADIDLYSLMLAALVQAERQRLRITHWRLNPAALMEIARHPITAQDDCCKPIAEREFFGIPLQIERNFDPPTLTPVFERWGRNLLIHDEPGEILHGNSMVRYHKAIESTTDINVRRTCDGNPVARHPPETP